MTGLMRAAKAGSLDNMRECIRRGAIVNGADDAGKTALMCVAEGDMPDGAARLRLLVAFGANIDAVDSFGNTAAMRAALAGRWAMVEALEALGADMLLGNYHGIIPEYVQRFMLEWQDRESESESGPESELEPEPEPEPESYDERLLPLIRLEALARAYATGALPQHDEREELIDCLSLSYADVMGQHFASH